MLAGIPSSSRSSPSQSTVQIEKQGADALLASVMWRAPPLSFHISQESTVPKARLPVPPLRAHPVHCPEPILFSCPRNRGPEGVRSFAEECFMAGCAQRSDVGCASILPYNGVVNGLPVDRSRSRSFPLICNADGRDFPGKCPPCSALPQQLLLR